MCHHTTLDHSLDGAWRAQYLREGGYTRDAPRCVNTEKLVSVCHSRVPNACKGNDSSEVCNLYPTLHVDNRPTYRLTPRHRPLHRTWSTSSPQALGFVWGRHYDVGAAAASCDFVLKVGVVPPSVADTVFQQLLSSLSTFCAAVISFDQNFDYNGLSYTSELLLRSNDTGYGKEAVQSVPAMSQPQDQVRSVSCETSLWVSWRSGSPLSYPPTNTDLHTGTALVSRGNLRVSIATALVASAPWPAPAEAATSGPRSLSPLAQQTTLPGALVQQIRGATVLSQMMKSALVIPPWLLHML